MRHNRHVIGGPFLEPPWGEQCAGQEIGGQRRIVIRQRELSTDSRPGAGSLRGSLDGRLRRGNNVPEVCRLWATRIDVAEWLRGLGLEQ